MQGSKTILSLRGKQKEGTKKHGKAFGWCSEDAWGMGNALPSPCLAWNTSPHRKNLTKQNKNVKSMQALYLRRAELPLLLCCLLALRNLLPEGGFYLVVLAIASPLPSLNIRNDMRLRSP